MMTLRRMHCVCCVNEMDGLQGGREGRTIVKACAKMLLSLVVCQGECEAWVNTQAPLSRRLDRLLAQRLLPLTLTSHHG